MTTIDDSTNFYGLLLGTPLHNPNHYELLGIEYFSDDPETILKAATDQNRKLMKWQNSNDYHRHVKKLMMAVAEAKMTLMNPESKIVYDRDLRESTQRIINRHRETVLVTKTQATPVSSEVDSQFLKVAWGLAASIFLLFLVLVIRSSYKPESKQQNQNESFASAFSQSDIQKPINPLSVLNVSEGEERERIEDDDLSLEFETTHSEVLPQKIEGIRPDNTTTKNENNQIESIRQTQKNEEITSNPTEVPTSLPKLNFSRLFPGVPTLTRRKRTIIPISLSRIKDGDLTFTNLNNLAFAGPDQSYDRINDYKTDGTWGIEQGVLKQLSGDNAAMALGITEGFALDMVGRITDYGGCFFLIGWDGANGYLAYHTNAYWSSIDWKICEIRQGAWVEETDHSFDKNYRPRGWNPISISVNGSNKLTWKVGPKVLCEDYNLSNYKRGAVVMGTYNTISIEPPILVKSMTIRGR